MSQLRDDLIKAWIAIDSDTCPEGLYSADYLKEKIELILRGEMIWHHRIEQACENTEATYGCIKRRRYQNMQEMRKGVCTEGGETSVLPKSMPEGIMGGQMDEEKKTSETV